MKMLVAFLLFMSISVIKTRDFVDVESSYIKHDEEGDFFEADSRLTRELNRRMGSRDNVSQILSRWKRRVSPDTVKKEAQFWGLEQDEKDFLSAMRLHNDTRRSYSWIYPNDPQNFTMKYKILDMMQQAIYATQKRVDVFQNISAKYEKHTGFIFGAYFAALDKWLTDMYIAYCWVTLKRRIVWVNIIYHSHLAKKNVDITYTVEQLTRLYNQRHSKLKSPKVETDTGKLGQG
ncbi:hypothetical protein K1T71_010007 [Dendrolimus kikuchii]|uniref:Uncharacterized protein n=1 Tax=Dendrolimus kikuchii TaxID=765133 RepID=A0ACC1CT78_9NEOP|nr:hypothetical protein K1T71_010007 [Dendrolimus kikuchii]